MKSSTIYLAIAIVMAVIAGASLSSAYKLANRPINERVGTLIVYDTIREERPVEVQRIPVGYEITPVGLVADLEQKVSTLVGLVDSMEQNPTIIVRDSLVYVQIPIEQKVYQGEQYKLGVSGYKPNLDYIEIYQQTQVVQPKPKRWSIGVQAGYGMTLQGFSPYLGIGLSYGFMF